MAYLDGFLAAVPAANRQAYRDRVVEAVPLFREFGAKRVVETWGDDVRPGERTDFPRGVQATADEVVVFSWMEYADKAARDAAGERMATDPRMQASFEKMPFDAMRMMFGGFEVVVDVGDPTVMGYIDGTLLPVDRDARAAFVAHNTKQSAVFREHGAARVVAAWGDDVPAGTVTDFLRATAATEHETVVFSWVAWPSKAVRDAAWPKIFGDARMHNAELAASESRRVFGGFVPLVDA